MYKVAHALFRGQVPKAHAPLRGFYRIEPVIVMSGKSCLENHVAKVMPKVRPKMPMAAPQGNVQMLGRRSASQAIN
jgi:hypothetical protein